MSIHQVSSLLKQTYSKWSSHNATRLGASVAFYSILSSAPLLLLLTAVIGMVFGSQSAHTALVNNARQFMGDRGATMVDSLLKNNHRSTSGIVAGVIAFITLLFGASGVFTELREALNIMWDTTRDAPSGIAGMIKERLVAFAMIFSIGLLLLVSLLLSAAVDFMGHTLSQLVPIPGWGWQGINFLVSLVLITVVFALMYKYVPSADIAWKDVVVGAIGTALLFTIGKLLLGIYLARASVEATYGAAGTLVAVVVWIYYSAQIFFFGAEFTRVYADTHGSRRALRTKQAPTLTESIAPSSPQPAPLRSINVALLAPPAKEPEVVTAGATPKPKLLLAMGLGFVLGTISWAISKRHSASLP